MTRPCHQTRAVPDLIRDLHRPVKETPDQVRGATAQKAIE